jgi:hypothetical protein
LKKLKQKVHYRQAERKGTMYSANMALLEQTDDQLDQRPVITPSAQSVQSIQSVVPTQGISARNADSGYHFVMAESQKGCAAWYIVNGHGVPVNTLTSFARQLASTVGLEHAQEQLAPLLSYLTWQAQNGLLWYDPASSLQKAWQDYLRQSASYRKRAGVVVMVLAAIVRQDRVSHTLRCMLRQFYTFAIACQTYGYHHPFVG